MMNQVPSDIIIQEISNQIISRINKKEVSLKIKRASADIQGLLKQGDKDLIYLESFACTLMCILNNK